ncbi:MAG: cysteine desulfurase [Alphaproteobacteria bacterium]|nr:cysteine desulfurase [Alphaproteobacteria bacterium]
MSDQTYLDYNATAPLRPEAFELMSALMAAPHNASSVHGLGRAGRLAVEKAREQVAVLAGVPSTQVIFNSGATEANNTVIRYFRKDGPVLVSAIEHPSVLEAADDLIRIPVETNGVVDLNALEALLSEHKPALVSVMMVNNETGVIQPIAEISALAKKYGAMLHCDGVQAAGRIPINMAELGIDFLSLSAHKIGGPQGVGALVLGLCGITPSLLHGGGQEKSARAGTENVAGIAGFGVAAELASIEDYQNLAHLRDEMEARLREISPEIIIHGQNAPRVAGTSMLSLPGVKSETMLMALDLDGVAISNGSACSSGTVKTSHVLKAMGAADEVAGSALRISMGWNTSPEDIECFLAGWEKLYARLQDKVRAHA